jgi:hypothetical protein
MTPRLLVLIALPLAFAYRFADAQTSRTPWGDPDLQGSWSNATLTPLQRPADLKDKEFFTPEEAKVYIRERLKAGSADERIEEDKKAGNVGAYNDAWTDRGNDIVPTRHTSLIVDPKNGRVPPFTAEAQREHERNLAYAAAHPADTPEDRYLTERCIGFGGGHAPMLPEPYNNNYYIVQTPDYVSIMAELNHEVRIIPIDGRGHFPNRVTQWVGDSRGHFEGDTLVVETTNQKTNPHYYGVQMLDSVMSNQFRVVERLTRTAADQVRYRATVYDPVFTAPWTVEIFMHPQKGQLVEYACHEGNYGMSGLLSGTREEERKAAGGKR